ncbi:uncharacterized protein L203_102076 [Cryptococcus depauperatus CBS 7841]|uniref:ER membrane protein complex subunit 6 n=1 Tax=Cryptococcus depauperatus CBS 7841 TaxID=1295531 RepID=A0A1E3IT83_9TREE|nr:hypothetical protein L203_01328 [Cryptococcus depauperatus CBS 7841]ODN95568.1 hypothetical protein L204_04109 [Cryptococcus depauperatus CBS 7855]
MDSGGPQLATQPSPEESPLYPPSVIHNTQIFSSINTLSACFTGLVVGILGLTNISGFLLFFASSVITAVAIGVIKCRFDVERYVPKGQHQGSGKSKNRFSMIQTWRGWWTLAGIGQENFLGFLLFWIGSYALIHVYD